MWTKCNKKEGQKRASIRRDKATEETLRRHERGEEKRMEQKRRERSIFVRRCNSRPILDCSSETSLPLYTQYY